MKIELSTNELAHLREEVRYLRFLVWKLSVRDLAEQHPKYRPWLRRTYVSTRERDFGVDDTRTG